MPSRSSLAAMLAHFHLQVPCVVVWQTRSWREAPGLAREIRTAAIVLLVQAAGLLVVAVSLLVRTASGGARSSVGGLSDVGLSIGGTVLLVVLAAGLVRLSVAARTPVLVIEILTVPIAYSLAVQSHQPQWGVPILISAVAVLVLLFLPPAREQLQR